MEDIPFSLVIVLIVFRAERGGGHTEREAKSPNGGERSSRPGDLTTARATSAVREIA